MGSTVARERFEWPACTRVRHAPVASVWQVEIKIKIRPGVEMGWRERKWKFCNIFVKFCDNLWPIILWWKCLHKFLKSCYQCGSLLYTTLWCGFRNFMGNLMAWKDKWRQSFSWKFITRNLKDICKISIGSFRKWMQNSWRICIVSHAENIHAKFKSIPVQKKCMQNFNPFSCKKMHANLVTELATHKKNKICLC